MSPRAAATASAASRSRAAARPSGPPAGSQVASSVRIVPRPSRHRLEQARQVDHDRSLEALGPGRPRQPAEQRRATAQLDPQVHHDAFPLGIDGGVGDLGERLAQVVGDRPVEAAAAGRRRVVAHAPQRLVAFERHRLDVEPCAFGIEAGEVAHDVVGRRCRAGGRSRPAGAMRSSYIGRAASWIGSVRSAQAFASASSRIARRPGSTRSSSPGPRRPRRTVSAALNGTAPASDATATSRSRGHREGRRPQPVPIDQRPDPLAVREDDRGGPIPRREEAGRAAAQRGDVRVRGATEPECLGDRRQQGGGQGPAGRGQELERLVERERIGAVGGQERPGGEEGARRSRRSRRRAAAPADLLAVATDRVDLAVMGDRAERLCEPPDRMRVRRVALVEDRVAEAQRRSQVGIEIRQAATRDEALVDDRPRRGRRDGDLGKDAAGRPRGGLEPAGARRPGGARRHRRTAAAGRPRHVTDARRSRGRRPVASRRPSRRAPRRRTARTATRRSSGRSHGTSSPRAPGHASAPRGTAAGTARRCRARRPQSSPAISASNERDSGNATPAPSLDTPSAPNAPRWLSAARPASANGSTRSCDRPPASATNPTPQASCSKRSSYSGAIFRSLGRLFTDSTPERVGNRPPSMGSTAAGLGSADVGREAPGVTPDRRPRRGLTGRGPSPRPPC